ncbi:NTP transferase domain-containing protein [Streptomyces sp. ISL-87]|nr:NTP transferase domain-containing protein [Streptomyces sp. ISL-21]MBT2607666.1 NTP transferase domain-containing protein [Streptomyces sp. ISL-87]
MGQAPVGQAPAGQAPVGQAPAEQAPAEQAPAGQASAGQNPAGQAPRVLAVIPARGGSKGVPGKNLAEVAGIPLVARAVQACLAAPTVTDVVVSTDSQAIADAAEAAGADVIRRPAAISGDTASSEAAVLHTLDAFEELHSVGVDVVLLVQCTSPFLTPSDVESVAAAVAAGAADSALTVAPFHGFLWREGEGDGAGHGVNHDKAVRPRRQDRPQDLLETGAAYAMAADGFRTARHRFFGRTLPVATDPARVLEIDDPHDLARARLLAPLFNVRPGTQPDPKPDSRPDTRPTPRTGPTLTPPQPRTEGNQLP